MSRRHRVALFAVVAILAGLMARGRPVTAQSGVVPAPPVAWAVVTYLSGTTVYLEVGSHNGVREGTRFAVVRGGTVIAELVAKYVSSSRSACTTATSTALPVVGDSVRYVPAPDSPAAGVAAGNRPRASSHLSPLRGRVGLRYLVIDQGAAGTLTQPSLDLRLDGSRLGGTALGVAVDVRTQRTTLSGGSGTVTVPDGQTRVYQAALTVQRGVGATRWALGRQFATALSPIGIFDGAALDINGARWSGGFLAGTEPDAATFAPSGTTTEYGLWIQRHGSPSTSTPWSATLGAIGSYDRGEINREFVYLRTTYNSRHLSLYAAQEIDINRGWKSTLEGSFATFTSRFVTAQLNITDAFYLSGGLDTRRSVRLYRDFLNPEIVFDDAFRQGEWGEASLRLGRHVRVSTDIRTNGGGTDGTSQAVTGALYITQITPLGLSLRARSTQYTSPLSEGTLTSAALDLAPRGALRLSVNGGVRTSAVPGSGLPPTRLTWAGGDLDLAIGRSWYLLLSTYRESGTSTAPIQTYASLTWRF